MFPSLRASRTPPLAAVRELAVDTSGQSARRLISGAVVSLVGIVAYAVGLTGGGIEWVGVGALATFVGVFMLGPLIARPISAVLGAPIAAGAGVAGSIARQNAMRNPKRTSRTGGALMVGVALVAAITVIAASVRDWTRDFGQRTVHRRLRRQHLHVRLRRAQPRPRGPGRTRSPRSPSRAGCVSVPHMTSIGNGDLRYLAVDPATASQLFDVDMVTGSIAGLTAHGILLDDGEAAARGVGVGDTVTFAFLDGSTRTLTVEGIYRNDDVVGAYVVSQALHAATGVDQFDFSVYVDGRPGVATPLASTRRSNQLPAPTRTRRCRAGASTSTPALHSSTRS